MKKLSLLLFVLFILNSCEKPSDCIESSGTIITKDIPVTNFKKIKVYRGIEVIITQGTEYKVQIVAGENFIDNIEVNQNGFVEIGNVIDSIKPNTILISIMLANNETGVIQVLLFLFLSLKKEKNYLNHYI